ncbi:long-chain-fatty-acid--CoA ligase [Caballeronia hypogeia]|uniref:Long-chain-fatty-acid--CoA ligase n=1 Tax=Caballeronia hypogeia TaxID=1777140 RepID=A0A158AS41_9BURK|nr:long-chain-fatty-acid--CoA ligase [Caballeronia hypogeia]
MQIADAAKMFRVIKDVLIQPNGHDSVSDGWRTGVLKRESADKQNIGFHFAPPRCEAAYLSSVIVSDSAGSVRPTSRTSRASIPTASAVCIAARHHEPPQQLVARRPGSAFTVDELLVFFHGQAAKGCKPDAVAFVESVPLGATGKVSKHRLRERYADYDHSA